MLALGIPGLLLYGTLGVAQWRTSLAMNEFTRLQKAYPPDSLKNPPAEIQLGKLQSLTLAERLAPDNPEVAYQTSLLHLVRAETESLQPPAHPAGIEDDQDPRLAASLKDGLAWINRAIILNPGYAEYQFVKASILQNLSGIPGEESEASVTPKAVASLLHEADRLDPYRPSLHFRIGSFWIALDERDQARDAFAITLSDSIHYARPVFSLLWSSVNDVSDLEKFVGESSLARALLTTFLLDHGYSNEAESEFKNTISLPLADYSAVVELADYALRTGNPSAARTVLTKIEPNDGSLTSLQRAHLKYLQGQSFHAEGRLQDAIACFEDAIRIGTEDSYIHEALGNAYQETGDYDRAIARYLLALNRMATVMEPTKVSILHTELAAAYEKKEDFAKAIEHYFRAAQIDPTNISAQKRASELTSQHL
jgi:tetratricopeptide (TPR) repeat protein